MNNKPFWQDKTCKEMAGLHVKVTFNSGTIVTGVTNMNGDIPEADYLSGREGNEKFVPNSYIKSIELLDDPELRLQAAQAYATLELAEQTRIQTLLFCRQFGEISDAAHSPKFKSDEADPLGTDCFLAITDDDLDALGVKKKVKDFG